ILQEIEAPVPVHELLSQLHVETQPLYEELMARRRTELGGEALQWWDLLPESRGLHAEFERSLPAESALALALRTLQDGGFDPQGLGISVILEPRFRRSRHAFRFPLRVPGDVRVLAQPGAGLRAVELLVHELGHALYTSQIDQDVWEYRAPAAVCFTEAVG